jgi:histidine triad (HIT) family protein
VTPSIFSRIIAGQEPGHIVWADDKSVALLTIAPLSTGHTLVVPREEVDHWIDASPGLLEHCLRVAKIIARGQQLAFDPPRVGVVIAGFEVPHLHVHVFPAWSMRDFDWTNVSHPSRADLETTAAALRHALDMLPSSEC